MKRYLVIAAAIAGFTLLAINDNIFAAVGVFLLAGAIKFDA